MRLTPVFSGVLAAVATATLSFSIPSYANPKPADVEQTMKKATRFMVEEVSYRGGYVWSYLPDFSRRWGELEARETMIWVQPPGTATMGHLFLDAYHATGDEYYYEAAKKSADALIWGQHPSGGWNYLIDFAGEASIKEWYNTIGANGWRLEEFQHYYGNATFDDEGTAETAKFLLRLYTEKLDPKYKPPLERALNFVLEAQYPIGGWPQRYPLRYEFSHHGNPDYTSFITFNDDVALQNIEFLLMCYQALGETRVLDAVVRGMNVFIAAQQGQPQPGWALQYTTTLEPAGARTYEPNSIVTSTTVANIRQLMLFYRLTGQSKFLARIPEALDWLDEVRLPDDQVKNGRTHPTFVEIGTNKPLYVYRRGSNVTNGEYFTSYQPGETISHYGSTRHIDVESLRAEYEKLAAMPVEEATKGSPLLGKDENGLPQYFMLGDVGISSDLNTRAQKAERERFDSSSELVQALMKDLNKQGYWPAPLLYTTNPYIGPAPEEVAPGDFSAQHVGDKWDTSPYRDETPVMGISTGMYIENMTELIRYLVDQKR